MNKKEMFLESTSGYCMPFAVPEGKNKVVVSRIYGEQRNPDTNEKQFNHGMDFLTDDYEASAVATGVVTGMGNDQSHGIFVIMRHGNYDVSYYGLSRVSVNYGQPISAGDRIGFTGKRFHLEVKCKGEEIDPQEFIDMLLCNVRIAQQAGKMPDRPAPDDMDIQTKYDKDKDEIISLMFRFLPSYIIDLSRGNYQTPSNTESSLRNAMIQGFNKNYFFENAPNLGNPMGLGMRSKNLVEKIQNMIIGDFLNYLALMQNVFLSTLSQEEKKKLRMMQNQGQDS